MKEHKTPFLWAGSKDKNWKEIKKYVPLTFENYVEPFVGGGSVYFRLMNTYAGKAKIADQNIELCNAYEMIRDNPDYLIKALPAFKDKCIFADWQKDKTSNLSKEDAATRFIYLNRNRFFGLGGWMCADRYARETVVERIKFFSEKMKSTTVYRNAFDVPLLETDWVFCDPPYPETNNASCYNIKNTDIVELNKKYLNKLKEVNCNFLFITKHIPEIQDLASELKFKSEVKTWNFRKPGKPPQLSQEIWISKK
jgi:DNA adenine methylase